MDWLDDFLTEYVEPAWEATKNFVVENPTIAGGLAGAAIGKATGSDNIGRDALIGAGLGYGAGQYFGSEPTFNPQPTYQGAGSTGAQPVNYGFDGTSFSAVPQSSPYASSSAGGTDYSLSGGSTPGLGLRPLDGGNSVSIAPVSSAVNTNFGNSGSALDPEQMARVQELGKTQGYAGKAGAALQTVRSFGQENKGVLDLGAKLYGAYQANKAGKAQQQYLDKVGARNDVVDARNTEVYNDTRGTMGKQNALADTAAAQTLATFDPSNAGNRAWASSMGATDRAVAGLRTSSMSKGLTPNAGEERRMRLAGSLGGVQNYTNAYSDAASRLPAGLSTASSMYKTMSPGSYGSYDASYGAAQGAGAAGTAKGVMGLYEDVFGVQKKKAETDQGTQVAI